MLGVADLAVTVTLGVESHRANIDAVIVVIVIAFIAVFVVPGLAVVRMPRAG